jgi:hypothetical protein
VAYNCQTGNNTIKLVREYESVSQKISLIAFMSGRKYVIPQNGDCSKERNIHAFIFQNKVRYQNTASLQCSMEKLHLQINAI